MINPFAFKKEKEKDQPTCNMVIWAYKPDLSSLHNYTRSKSVVSELGLISWFDAVEPEQAIQWSSLMLN